MKALIFNSGLGNPHGRNHKGPAVNIFPFYYDNYFIEEIDTIEDYQRVSEAIAKFDQAE